MTGPAIAGLSLRAATRGSPMALWQTRHVAELLSGAHFEVTVEAVVVSTLGDRRLDLPIASIGGKGVFAKEVQAAVLDGRADLAVHSGKDLPSVTPAGLVVAAVLARHDPRDALVGSTLAGLAAGARVGTGSPRRRIQLACLRPELHFVDVRGNVGTRLAKLDDGAADVLVLAVSGLRRLGLSERISEILEPSTMLPQVAQGTLVVECRAEDVSTQGLLAALEDVESRRRFDAERAFLETLGGDCDLPAGAHATLVDGGRLVRLEALIAVATGIERVVIEDPDPRIAGHRAGNALLAKSGERSVRTL